MMSNFDEYDQYDGLGLAELVHKQQVKPAEILEAAIQHIEKINPTINAVVHTNYEHARQQVKSGLPEGPFQGVPFLVKDLTVCCEDMPTSSGSHFFHDFSPGFDSELIRRYRAAGVVILGKTNTPEFGLVPFTEPEVHGPTLNPWDTTRSPGGSSGGSAAAVAARLVPMAHGGDGGGSIRIPASCCGLFGLKPTRGRNPTGPNLGEVWRGYNVDHVLTRSVRDSAAMLDATAGADPGAPYYPPIPARPYREEVGLPPGKLRIAYSAQTLLGNAVDSDVMAGFNNTIQLCQDLGHELEEAAPQTDGVSFTRDFLSIVCVETAAAIAESASLMDRKATWRDFEASTWAARLLGTRYRGAEIARAFARLQQHARRIGEFFESYDILLTPTIAARPVKTGELQPSGVEAIGLSMLSRLNAAWLLEKIGALDVSIESIFKYVPFTPIFNVTGQPAMSVPLHWTADGLPVGMQFVGRYADEATLFRLAAQLEMASPWKDKKVPQI